MKVYLMTTKWSGWEDPEANGSTVHVFTSEEGAIKRMNEAAKQEIEEEKEYGRIFYENVHFPKYISIVSQNSEYVEFEVIEKEVRQC